MIYRYCFDLRIPPWQVSEIGRLKEDQQFDLTAIIASVSDVRSAGTYTNGADRVAFDCVLEDGSTSGNEVVQVSVTMFSPKQSDFHHSMAAQCEHGKVASFFGINGSKDQNDTYSCRMAQDSWVCDAKTQKSEKIAPRDWEGQSVKCFATKTWDMEHRDYSQEMGTETSCQILAQLHAEGDRMVD